MDEEVRSNTIRLLRGCISAISKGDSFLLKELSNGNIHSASIFQDEDSLSLGVVIYALSKMIDKSQKRKTIVGKLRKALDAVISRDYNSYTLLMRELVEIIRAEDDRLKRFVSNVIEQAEVKKGSVLYEHGISIGRVAGILGISKWELMDYIGKTHFSEQSYETVPTEKRLALARMIFS